MTLLTLFNTPPHIALLNIAESLRDQNPGAAVVFAHTACEIFTEQVLAVGVEHRGVPELEQPVTAQFRSANLGNDGVRAVYEALTGDSITNKPFWQPFKESSARRNNVVHRGRMPTPDEARTSCTAARELIQHLATVVESMRQKRTQS